MDISPSRIGNGSVLSEVVIGSSNGDVTIEGRSPEQTDSVKKVAKAFLEGIHNTIGCAYISNEERAQIRYMADLTCTRKMGKNDDGTTYYSFWWKLEQLPKIGEITRTSKEVSRQPLFKILQGLGDLAHEVHWEGEHGLPKFARIRKRYRTVPSFASGIGKRLFELQKDEEQRVRNLPDIRQRTEEAGGDIDVLNVIEQDIRQQVLARIKADTTLSSSLNQINYPYEKDYLHQTFKIMSEYAPGTVLPLLTPASITPTHANQGIFIRFRELLSEAKLDYDNYQSFKAAKAAFDERVKIDDFETAHEKHEARKQLVDWAPDVEKGRMVEYFGIIDLINEYLNGKPPLKVTTYKLDQILAGESKQLQDTLLAEMENDPMIITEKDVDELRTAIISIYLTIKRKTRAIQKAYRLYKNSYSILKRIQQRRKAEVEGQMRSRDNIIANGMKVLVSNANANIASAVEREKVGLLNKIASHNDDVQSQLDAECYWHDKTIEFKQKNEGIIKEIEEKKKTWLYVLKVIVTFGFVAWLTSRELNRAKLNVESAEKSVVRHERKVDVFRRRIAENKEELGRIKAELEELKRSRKKDSDD